MYNYQPSLDLDLTGVNPDNKIKNEPHTLNTGEYRAIVPRKGLFYEASLVIMDGAKALVRNIDYICTPLHQDLSVKTGKGVFGGIIITNQKVSKNVSITYQAVGGEYGVDNDAIAQLYESVINDTRPVHWDNVDNKPSEFPPSAHDHLLEDVVNWTPIIHQLERVAQAISYSQVDLMKSNMTNLITAFKCGELPKVLPSSRVVAYDAMLHTMSMHNVFGPTKVFSEKCRWWYGRMATFEIDTSGFPEGHQFWWSFYKEGGAKIHLPVQLSGTVTGTGGIVKVQVYIPGMHTHEDEILYIGVNNRPFVEDFDAVTYRLDFFKPLFGESNYGMMVSTTGPDSDTMSVPAGNKQSDLSRVRYILEHTGMVNYYNL